MPNILFETSRVNRILRVPHTHIVGTRQNIGKSTIAHALFNAMRRSSPGDVGYIKPVATSSYDHEVFHREYQLHEDIADLNPVRIERKMTATYIMSEGDERETLRNNMKFKIIDSYSRVAQDKDFIIVEGTGHSAVGYCLDLSNAVVANLLNSPVTLLVEGGIGKTVDLSALHLEYFKQKGSQILGVIINRVEPGTWKKIGPPLEKNFGRLGIDILGYVYYNSVLAAATAREIGDAIEKKSHTDDEFKGSELLNNRNLEAIVKKPLLGIMMMKEINPSFKEDNLIVIIPSSSNSLISRIANLRSGKRVKQPAGMIIVGEDQMPSPITLNDISEAPFPIWRIPHGKIENVYNLVDDVIHEGNHKIDAEDANKISIVHSMVAEHIDVDKISKEAAKAAASLKWLFPNIRRYFLFDKIYRNNE